MKKKLNELFDEVRPEELDRFSDSLNAPALTDEVLASLKDKVCAKTKIKKEKKNNGGVWLHFAATAACFVLLVGIAVFLPTRNDDNPMITTTPTDTNPPIVELPNADITFDSLDKVNYYAGLKLIDQQKNTSMQETVTYTVTALSHCNSNSASIDLWRTALPGAYYASDSTKRKKGQDISGETLHITTAIYFQLIVTEEDEFLFSKIGAGTVDVIITDLHIGNSPYAMITFKNEECYFSCLTEHSDLQEENNRFSTHIYIDGFDLVKNASNGVSHFNVFYDSSLQEVTSVSWVPYNKIPSEAPVYPIALVPGSTQVTYETYDFTLYELAEYYHGTTDIPQEGDSTLPSETPSLSVRVGTESVVPMSETTRQKYYDKVTQQWMIGQTLSGPCEYLKSWESVIPAVCLSGEMEVVIHGEGTQSGTTSVYSVKDDGAYSLFSEFDCTVAELVGLLPAGEWYVVFDVTWLDDFVPEANAYELHVNTYFFKLIVPGIEVA